MSPKMRSIFAQVYQKSVSMGRSRNFCSSPTNFEVSKKRAIANFLVTRTVGFASGFLTGHYLFGDLDKILEERLEEQLREADESLKRREEILALVPKSFK
ncbi:uncharacterized protein LOC108831246 isoform X2 [Raphanus sativus]|uniref:Uncharacterized protein LOC108831246 isoform X2 n=1 Tax=Raphanus sativus TaxID=3726 RepID=A0A6J0LKT1_RAPSA|nr:uncharacterized protein LOC108831246 isoform X2 [Raphanus sativus]